MARKPLWQEKEQRKWYKEAVKHVSPHALAEHEADRDPSVWSPGLLLDYGAEMWAACPGCGVETNVALAPLIPTMARRPLRTLTLRCHGCGERGHTVVKWWSMAGTLCFYNLTTGEHKGGWKLLLKPPPQSRRAAPDPALPPLEPPKGYRVFEPEPVADGALSRQDDTGVRATVCRMNLHD